jgi:hypothetical protein
LASFLTREFDAVDRNLAARLVDEMRAGADASTPPRELTTQQLVRLHQLLHEARFRDPT